MHAQHSPKLQLNFQRNIRHAVLNVRPQTVGMRSILYIYTTAYVRRNNNNDKQDEKKKVVKYTS